MARGSQGVLPSRRLGAVLDGCHRGTLSPHVLVQGWSIEETLGVTIVRSVSPWASPIVVVPKRSAPGEPHKRRMCVDYRALNKLLPSVKKAHSNVKGVLSLVLLPKIDEIYACLKGSKVFSTLDMRSGYHHVEMTEEARPKTAFTLPANLGK